MESEKKKLYCFAGLLAFLLVGFYFPWLCGQKAFYAADINAYFEPLCRFIGANLRQGRLPLWNPYLYLGMSEVAVPSPGVFYPLNWLFAVLPFNQCFALLMVLHQMLAGLGAYLLITSFGWGAFAGAVAGITLALCGYMFSLQHNYTLVAGAAWLIVSLAFLQKIRVSEGEPEGVKTENLAKAIPSVILASLSAFMFFTSGRPEIVFPGAIVLAGFAVFSSLSDFARAATKGTTIESVSRKMMLQLISLAAGLLLAMPSILPALEWVYTSSRSKGLSPDEVFAWSANWYDYLCIFAAQPLGDLTQAGLPYLSLVQTCPNAVPFLASAYLGPVVLVLSIWGLCDKNFRFRFFLFVLFLVSVSLSLGSQAFIDPALVKIFPFISWFRFPVKLLIFPLICLAILAARGASVCLNRTLTLKSEMVSFAVCLLSLLFGADLFFGLGTPKGLAGQASALIGQSIAWSALIGLCVSAAARLFALGKIKARAFSLTLALILASSLLAYAAAYAHEGTDPKFFDSPAFLKDKLDQLSQQDKIEPGNSFRILPIYPEPFFSPPNYHRREIDSYMLAVEHYARQVLFPNINIDYGISSAHGYEAAETEDWKKIYANAITCAQFVPSASAVKSDLALERLCQISASRYVVTQIVQYHGPVKYGWPVAVLDPQLFSLALSDNYMNVRIYRVKNFMPRAYMTDSWRLSDNHEYPLTRLTYPDATGFDPKKTCIIEAVNINSQPKQTNSLGQNLAHIDFDLGDRLAVSTNSPEAGLLVLANQYYPGWKAWLDGKPCEIYRANGVQQSVFLPGGSHKVEFAYDPRSLKLGYFLLFCGVLILVFTVFALKRSVSHAQ